LLIKRFSNGYSCNIPGFSRALFHFFSKTSKVWKVHILGCYNATVEWHVGMGDLEEQPELVVMGDHV
jgi:hypothetical protein